MKKIMGWIKTEVPAIPVDLFRILVGLLSCIYFFSLIIQIPDFSSNHGFLDHALMRNFYLPAKWTLFPIEMSDSLLYSIYTLGFFSALMITAGYKTKLFTLICFLIAFSQARRNLIVFYVDDNTVQLVLFWLLFFPTGSTFTLAKWLKGERPQDWLKKTVEGTPVRLFLLNVAMVYLLAGGWKLTSAFWQEGFALYAVLRLPIAHFPDLFGAEDLLYLKWASHLSIFIEMAIPIYLFFPKGSPWKKIGLLCQWALHLGICLSLKIPFANLALLATGILFFDQEIVSWFGKEKLNLKTRLKLSKTSWAACLFFVLLSLSVLRGIPLLGAASQPASAVLWVFGIFQEYRLFNWIDYKAFRSDNELYQVKDGKKTPLPKDALFPTSLRGILLDGYLHDLKWVPIPDRFNRELKSSIMKRLSQRFCQKHEGTFEVYSTLNWVIPENANLKDGVRIQKMKFQCEKKESRICSTFFSSHSGCE